MEIIIGLLLLASFILWVVNWRDASIYIDRAMFACLLLAVALLAFADRLVR